SSPVDYGYSLWLIAALASLRNHPAVDALADCDLGAAVVVIARPVIGVISGMVPPDFNGHTGLPDANAHLGKRGNSHQQTGSGSNSDCNTPHRKFLLALCSVNAKAEEWFRFQMQSYVPL